MIDLSKEQVISFAAASRLFPERRAGKRPNISCFYRWSKTGCRGVVLETIMAGATRVTSIEALQRFCDTLTAQAALDPVPPPASPARQSAIRRAEAEMAQPVTR